MPLRVLCQTVLALSLASPVWAVEFVVTNLQDSGAGSLRDAVAQANALSGADTIRFEFSALPGGGQRVINLTSDGLVISSDIQILGLGPRELVVQRSTDEGTPEFRVFDVTIGNKSVTISGMTVRNGDAGGIRGGGALATSVGNKVRLHDVVVDNNTAAAPRNNSGGGAIFNVGQLTITGSQFLNNSATMPVEIGADRGGGAIYNLGTLTIDKSVFSGNNFSEGFLKTVGSGGAIFNAAGGNLTVTNSSFDGNNVSGFGGAIINEVGGTMSLIKNTISGNSATDGGGILNLGTIDQLKGNIISGNTSAPDGAENAPDLGLGFPTTGTINSASGNIVGQTSGHGLDPATNQLGVDPNLEPLKDNGGPTPSRKPDPDGPAKDQGDGSTVFRFDQRGFFANVGDGTDVGSVETGNRVFIAASGAPAAWFDSSNWLDGNVPGEGDPVWIVDGRTADLTGSVSIDVDSLNVGVSGDVGDAAGSVVGSDILISSDTIDVGSAYGVQSPLNDGNGDISLTNATISTNTLRVGNAESTGDDILSSGTGNITITSQGGGASTLTVNGNAGFGTAAAFAPNSTSSAHGSLQFDGQSAQFGALFFGEALASDGAGATSSSHATIETTQDVVTGSLAAGTALSGPDSTTIVSDVEIDITASRFAINGPARIGTAQVSGAAEGAPNAEVADVMYSVTAGEHTISNRLSLGVISASTFGPAGEQPATSRIGAVRGDLNVDTLNIISGVEVATIFANGTNSNSIDEASLTISNSDTSVSGGVSVGTMFLSSDASGVIGNSLLDVRQGSFTVTDTPAGFASLRIATIDAFTPAGLAQTTAIARFADATVNLAGGVTISSTNSAGAAPASMAHGTLELNNSEVTAGGDVILAETSGVATIASSLATVRLNPSLLSIVGDLRMGDGAMLDFTIEGLTRPELGSPGDYGAIDAAGARLDGQLVVNFDFSAVADGQMFELIRLHPGGVFTGDFDSFTAGGLPVGLGIQPLFTGDSFFVEVISLPPLMLTGDTNADGTVNIDDLNNVRNNFGAAGPNDGTLTGDAFPFDGQVNIDDLNAVRNNFGAVAAPEPSTLALLWLMAWVATPIRRFRRSVHNGRR